MGYLLHCMGLQISEITVTFKVLLFVYLTITVQLENNALERHRALFSPLNNNSAGL